jgi:hypothetical protein
MFIPDAAHKQRVADAVEQAASTGDVVLKLSPDEASNLHVMAVAHYRQVREELDQPLRNALLAVLQILDEATKAALEARKAQSLRDWRFVSAAAALLVDGLGQEVNAMQGARLLGCVQGVELMTTAATPPDYAAGRLLPYLADLLGKEVTGLDDDEIAKFRTVGDRLFTIYRETE